METKTMNREKILKIIGLSLFAVAILLAFIGCFGAIGTATGSAEMYGEQFGGSSSYSFTWLFKEMWDEVSAAKGTPVYALTLIYSILALTSYIAVLASVVYIATKTLIAFIKNKDATSICYCKSVKLLVSTIVAFVAIIMSYLFVGVSFSYGNDSITAKLGLGWGTTLMVVGSIVALVACALSHIKSGMSKNEIISFVLNRLVLVILVFIAIFGFKETGKLVGSSVGEGNETMLLGIFYLYLLLCGNNETGIFVKDAGAKAMIIISIILVFAMIAFVILAINAKKNKTKVVYLGLILGLSIAVGVMAQAAINRSLPVESREYGGGGFGGASIVNIVLCTVAAVLTIVSMKLAPTQEVKKVAAPKETTKE